MFGRNTRRDFLSHYGSFIGAGLLASAAPEPAPAATSKGPGDFIIVEGHRDIWEQSGRARLKAGGAQQWPLANFIGPRLIEAGVSVVIMPAGGDSLDERDDNEVMFEGSMRVLDFILSDIDKSGGKISLIKTKADVPSTPNRGRVQLFLDIEGGGSIQANPEPGFPRERSLALLRQFFRLGVRGMQLTHNGRNQLGDGRGIDKMGSKLTPFGVSVIQEMNRLGMMVGVSHLSSNGVFHAAEVSKHPIVSTHQNLERFVKSRPLVEIMDEEATAIAKTGGIVGIRYIVNVTTYKLLADEVEYLAKLVGPDHIGIGWLGHDKANPHSGEVEDRITTPFSGVEAQTMSEHWTAFIKMLSERGFSDDQIGLMLGGNYLKVWKQILPAV